MRNDVPITVIGNLTGDPELRFTPDGTAVCRINVAHNARRYNKDTQKWDDGDASFYRCTAWRQLAENIAETLTKGHRVVVTGSMRQQQWEKDGEKKSSWDLTIDAIGPDLTWATATVKKMARAGQGDTPPDDPWASGSKQAPATDDEPPF